MKIILDLGSGLTCKNELYQVRKMIQAVHDVDNRKHEIILKWQLFTEWGDLPPLHHGIFGAAYDIARQHGYATTASVFDWESAKFLSHFKVPFIKIACVQEVYDAGWVPSSTLFGWWAKQMVVSIPDPNEYNRLKNCKFRDNANFLCCIRKYPAHPIEYETTFSGLLHYGLSDHTDHTMDFYLVKKFQPYIYETHFCIDGQTGDDTGPHALRPNQLAELLEAI